jgi:hypothetical protein
MIEAKNTLEELEKSADKRLLFLESWRAFEDRDI